MRKQERTVSARVVRLREVSCGVYKATAPGAPVYNGEYAVTPRFSQQILKTRGRSMKNDLTVDAIEVSRTENPAGGNTIYIGGMIND